MEIGTAESVIPSPHLLCQIFNWKQQDESKKYVKGDRCSQSYCKVWSGATYLTLSKSLSRFAMLACALYPLSLVSLISHEFFHLQFSYHGSYSSYGLRYVSEDMEIVMTFEGVYEHWPLRALYRVTKKPSFYSTDLHDYRWILCNSIFSWSCSILSFSFRNLYSAFPWSCSNMLLQIRPCSNSDWGCLLWRTFYFYLVVFN